MPTIPPNGQNPHAEKPPLPEVFYPDLVTRTAVCALGAFCSSAILSAVATPASLALAAFVSLSTIICTSPSEEGNDPKESRVTTFALGILSSAIILSAVPPPISVAVSVIVMLGTLIHAFPPKEGSWRGMIVIHDSPWLRRSSWDFSGFMAPYVRWLRETTPVALQTVHTAINRQDLRVKPVSGRSSFDPRPHHRVG